MKVAKARLLNGRLAEALATLRHGEMIFISDAGAGVSANALIPLAPHVEVLDLGIMTGVPSLRQLLPVMKETGDLEGAIVAREMRDSNPEGRTLVDDVFGAEKVHEITYLPDMYKLRDRAKLVVQTGEYVPHGNVVLIGGYTSPDIPVEWLTSFEWRDELFSQDTDTLPSAYGSDKEA